MGASTAADQRAGSLALASFPTCTSGECPIMTRFHKRVDIARDSSVSQFDFRQQVDVWRFGISCSYAAACETQVCMRPGYVTRLRDPVT